jgi:type IV pilus assembly protein PilQ
LETNPSTGVVQGVRAFYAPKDKNLLLKVSLRALAPYHVNRDGNLLMVDFDALPGMFSQPGPKPSPQTVGNKSAATVVPLQKRPAASVGHRDAAKASKQEETRAELFESSSKSYAGQKMSFDFVDTDIRNILKLLAEVANLNIVWGSDVEGKISMRLDNVAWDQALEMVLKPNGLTYQIEDEVLWVVPRSKLVDMEITEKKRKGALMAAKRLQGVFEAKVVEFILLKHRKAENIYWLLIGDKRVVPEIPPLLDIEAAESREEEEGEEKKGKDIKIAALDLYLSYDSGTNMIIANGVRAKVDKVKELIRKLDVPQKQVMIETRIVEATTDFTRDLGIQWQSLDGSRPGIRRKWYNADGTERFDGSFSTNKPANWVANIGLAFGWITDGGLGSLALDASLALAQEDGKAKIISAPKVMTVNNGPAEVARGTVRYFPIRTLDTIDYKEIPALLSLTVIPTVSADDQHVTMKVLVTDNRELAAQTTDSDEGTTESPPGRTEKKITSTLIIKTGDTVVIGGIYQKSEINTDSGVPWLKDIPLLGYLFKADRKTENKTELLIFLTPTVVKSVIDGGSS